MKQDFRIALPFASVVKDTEHKQNYEIISEIGRGGSSIVYEVSLLGHSKHYALKEYYPLNEALKIKREGDVLSFEHSSGQGIADKYHAREQRILNQFLPKNNSEDGCYYIYEDESFEANGTYYVVTDLDDCQPLAESRTKDDLQLLLYALTDVCKGLDILHHRGVFHLDISSRNILILKNGTAKITDFGAAVTQEELDSHSLNYEDFNYTPAFSSMEVKRAANNGMICNINASCDTFSVCAILFRYTVQRNFDPTADLINPTWKTDLHIRYRGVYTKSYINKLIDILHRGLSGQAYRYSSAGELADDLQALTRKIEADKKSLHAIKSGGVTLVTFLGICLVAVLILFAITPAPVLILQSQLETIYYCGDEIVFELELQDPTGTDGIHIEDATAALKLSGFNASREITPIKNSNKYLVKLTDISFGEDGEKSICLEEVYRSEWFGKKNKSFVYHFSGYVNEPGVFISEPTFTKVNSASGHTLTYHVTFEVPANQKSAIHFSSEQISLEGFTADICVTQISDHTYEVTFSDIKGDVGTCTFSVAEGACILNNDALSRETTSPCFAIVDEEVSNYSIYMYLHVVSQDLRDGGYILLEHGSYTSQPYVSILDETMVHIEGGTADVCFEGSSYLLLDNLALNGGRELQIRIDTGAYISKENGSRSQAVRLEPRNPVEDQTIPTAGIMKLGKDTRYVKTGGDVVLLVFGSDETSCFINKTTDMVEATGFSYDDCQISLMGLTIRVVYTNVKPFGGETCVTLKNGVYKDLSGNESKEVTFPFMITP